MVLTGASNKSDFRAIAIAAKFLICYGKNLPLLTCYGERQVNSGEFGVHIMSVGPLVTSQELVFATDRRNISSTVYSIQYVLYMYTL